MDVREIWRRIFDEFGWNGNRCDRRCVKVISEDQIEKISRISKIKCTYV